MPVFSSQTEDYWSKLNEKAILSEMGRIINEYKEVNNIETLTAEEFTDIFGSDVLYPGDIRSLSKWDLYPWATPDWDDIYYTYEIDQIAITDDERDLMEADELSENDQLIDILDEYNEDLINRYYGSSPQILENELYVGDTADNFYKQIDDTIYYEMISVILEVDYLDYNETLSEISNDFWSGGQGYDQFKDWLVQIGTERSETFLKINAEGHGPELSASEINAIIGLSGARYLSAPIDIKLGDAILSMLRIVHFFKFEVKNTLKWYKLHKKEIDQEEERYTKEQNVNSLSNEQEWIMENSRINNVFSLPDLMLQVLFTINGSHYKLTDRDYDLEEELDKIFLEMPFGHEFDRTIIDFLLLPLYHSTHAER